MTARFVVADVFDGLATIPDASVDLIVTSPPFLALRTYLPHDHPDKAKEIGQEGSPAPFVDTLLDVTAEMGRVLAPHGSICLELGDTYAGSGGAGGDYDPGGWRDGQPRYRQGTAHKARGLGGPNSLAGPVDDSGDLRPVKAPSGWPLAKCLAMVPEAYRIALAYGINPLTGAPSPAGRWRVRNVVRWVRPNPPVGDLADKWRPATSDLVVATRSPSRYWDDLATRRPHLEPGGYQIHLFDPAEMTVQSIPRIQPHPVGVPLLDYWEIPPGGYLGAHYAVFPSGLVEPCIKAMTPPRVCKTCGLPSRRIIESRRYDENGSTVFGDWNAVEPGTRWIHRGPGRQDDPVRDRHRDRVHRPRVDRLRPRRLATRSRLGSVRRVWDHPRRRHWLWARRHRDRPR